MENRFNIGAIDFVRIPSDWPTSRLSASAYVRNPIHLHPDSGARPSEKRPGGRYAAGPFLATARLWGPVPLRFSALRALSKTKIRVALHRIHDHFTEGLTYALCAPIALMEAVTV